MSADLPDLSEDAFRRGLAACSPRELGASPISKLFQHYQELRLWNRKLSLVGPGTSAEVLSRHYCEALEALKLLPEEPCSHWDEAHESRLNLVDIGSGGGFPGFVLAAVCPGLHVTLVEARQKKWSFLKAASRKAGVALNAINSRVQIPLPEAIPDTIHFLALRALSLPAPVLEALRSRLPRSGRLLLWQTLPQGEPPSGFERLRTLVLPGSERRCIGEYGIEGERAEPEARR